MIDFTIRASVVLLVALASVWVFRRRSAAIRHWILAAAVFCCAGLPLFQWVLPSLEWAAPVPAPTPVLTLSTPPSTPLAINPVSAAATIPERELHPATAPSLDRTPPSRPRRSVSLGTVAKLAYNVGLTISLAALALSLLRLWRIGRLAQPVADAQWARLHTEAARSIGFRRPPLLLEAKSPAVLATWGFVRPRIVVPAGSSDWSEDRIRIVLAHELAHVRRRDWLVQLAAEVLRAALWFNPLVWIVCRRLRQESEHACDDAVLNRGIAAADYAAHLLDLAKLLGSPAASWAPALLMARPSTLEKRFMAILNPSSRRNTLTPVSLVLTLGFLLGIAVPVAALRAVPAAVPTPSLRTLQNAVLAVLPVQTGTSPVPVPNSISGVVVRLGSSDPISDVDVELRRVEGTTSFPLGPLVAPRGNFSPGAIVRATAPNPTDLANGRTKADGRFLFTGLKPGKYRLQAARAGGDYYPAEFGQRDPRGAGYDFQFLEGQSMSGVRLEMAPTGSISGRVVDEEGRPAARVRVLALQVTHASGKRDLGIIQAVQTDDKGEYRLFWLPPGQFTVAARPEDPRRRTLSLFVTPPGSSDGWERYPKAPVSLRNIGNDTVIEETFEAVYFGGDRDVRNARSVELRPGDNLNGIDISLSLSRVRARRVQGTIIGSLAGRPVPNASVQAIPRGSGPSMVAPATNTDASGNFELVGLGTGAYTIVASAGTGAATFKGFALIDASEGNVDGLTVPVGPGSPIRGRFLLDGRPSAGTPFDMSRIQISLESQDSTRMSACCGVPSGDAFEVPGVQPGTFRVRVTPQDLEGAYLKSVRFNADDALEGPIVVGEQLGQLEVIVGLNGGTVEGRVTDRQQPAANATVVLIPSVRTRTDLYRNVSSDGDGKYRIQGIAPGEYRVVAWDFVEQGRWFDPGFLQTQEAHGARVRVAESARVEVNLTMEKP